MTVRFELRGFTLIELMIAITIIAILATIGIVTYDQAQKVARDGKRKGDMREIQKAAEQYYAVNSSTYPATLSSSTVSNSSYFPAGTIPKDPKNVSPFVYTYYPPVAGASGCNRYIMCARLENNTGNRAAYPTDGCTQPVEESSGTLNLYCVGSVSN